jgi:Protein of unknown function (DUF2867)
MTGHFLRHRRQRSGPISRSTLFFAPTGLFGLAYWYLLSPIHGFIFSRLIRALAQDAAARAEPGAPNSCANLGVQVAAGEERE